MDKFIVRIPITLTLEVEAPDADAAVQAVDGAFQRADPFQSPNITLVPKSALVPLRKAHIVGVIVTGPAFGVD